MAMTSETRHNKKSKTKISNTKINNKMKKTTTESLRSWWRKYYVGRSKSRAAELESWKEGVTFEDLYNLIRSNGTETPEKGVVELVWNTPYGDMPYARQCLYRELARRYNIHGGNIDLPWHPDYGLQGAGVDYNNFLTKWIHE